MADRSPPDEKKTKNSHESMPQISLPIINEGISHIVDLDKYIQQFLDLRKTGESLTDIEVLHPDAQDADGDESAKEMSDDDDFDINSQPKKKPKYKKKGWEPKMATPHNTNAQLFGKLLKCLEQIKDKFKLSPEVFKMKPNKKQLNQIISDPSLHDALHHIFSTDMLIQKIIKGRVKQPQRSHNIQEVQKLKAKFELISDTNGQLH